MRKSWLFLLMLAAMLTLAACSTPTANVVSVSPPVKDQLWNALRANHYEGYPNNFTGFVYRPGNDTTSETVAYYAMLECGNGSMVYCDKILTWADQNMWSNDGFAWYYKKGVGLSKGKDSAADGDIPIEWGAMKAYQRTGDVKYQLLFNKWTTGSIAGLDCKYGNITVLASGSGIGRWNGCYSFNGVYSAYVMLPFLKDMSEYDARWTPLYTGAVKQMDDLYAPGLPGRCAAYNGTNIDWTKCELNPPYHDYFDAQRAELWTGMYCKRVGWQGPVCQKQIALAQRLVAADFGVSNSGYEMNTAARGPVQFNEFSAALWSTNINGTGRNAIPSIAAKWTPAGFPGTGYSLDAFKDTLILIAMVEQDGGFGTSVSPPPPIIPPPGTNETAICQANLMQCQSNLNQSMTTIAQLENQTMQLQSALDSCTIQREAYRLALVDVNTTVTRALS